VSVGTCDGSGMCGVVPVGIGCGGGLECEDGNVTSAGSCDAGQVCVSGVTNSMCLSGVCASATECAEVIPPSGDGTSTTMGATLESMTR